MNVRSHLAMSLHRYLLGAGFAAIAAVAACSSSSDPGTGNGTSASTCKAGDTTPCTCADGTAGTQVCGATACTCSGSNNTAHDAGSTPPPPSEDAGTDSGIQDGDGGHLHDASPPPTDAAAGTYGAACTADKDCTDPVYNACFVGGQRSFCTKHCKTAADCPNPPTTGTCNKQLYCK
jgi:hypothetical protein